MNLGEGHVLDRLDGYLDGELDPFASLAIERHLADCPLCRSDYEVRQALAAQVRRQATYHQAPPRLRVALQRELGAETAPAARLSGGPGGASRWLAAAAAFVLGAGLSAGGVLWLDRGAHTLDLPGQVVADHVRSLQVENRLMDVASSDRHTVKPWFNGRLDYSPPVEQQPEGGYELAGARLDYLAGRPVAALVYRHLHHVINVFVWPEAGRALPVTLESRRGYAVAHWRAGEMTFWAASDVAPEDLKEFGEKLQAGTAGGAEPRP